MEIQYGTKLKEARVEKDLSLEEVSDDLKINLRTLRRMEESETKELPKAPFTRGFLKTYSTYLSVDSKMIIEAYNETLGEPSSKLKKGVLKEDSSKGTMFALDFFKEQVFPFVLLASTLAGAMVIYSFLRQSPFDENSVAVEEAPVVKPLKVVEPAPVVEEVVKVVEEIKPIETKVISPVAKVDVEEKKEEEVLKEVAVAPVVKRPVNFANKLVVEPLAKTALYIKTDLDKSPVKATLKPDKKRTFRFDNAQIKFLDAGAVNIILNGTDLGALGGFGEIKKIEFPSLEEL